MTTSSTRYLIGIGAAVVLIPLMLIVMIASSGNPNLPELQPAAQQELKADAPIPAKYVAWVKRAGKTCPEIGPALIAAQIDAESGWNESATAVNPPEKGGNATGLAQFQDGTWKTWGSDADGDGANSPTDGEDAIMALAKLMCSNISWAKTELHQKTLTGDPLELALAAYFCGRQCVLDAKGVPSTGKAREYPQRVLSRLGKYGLSPAAGATGQWTLPLASGSYRIVSGFGPRAGKLHAGTDFSAPKGTPIRAASAGKVIAVICNAGNNNCDVDGSPKISGCGWYVDIQHAGNIITRYCHMLRKPNVTVGQDVPTGHSLGVVGSSGNSSGAHLHFEVHKVKKGKKANNDNAVNPVPFLRSVNLSP
ncbi:MAG: peptidoglycan DD-metalloendopeptidase family protein [Pseudomonas fluorescens]